MVDQQQRVAEVPAGGGMVRELASGEQNTAVALVEARKPGWPLLFVSDGFAANTGACASSLM